MTKIQKFSLANVLSIMTAIELSTNTLETRELVAFLTGHAIDPGREPQYTESINLAKLEISRQCPAILARELQIATGVLVERWKEYSDKKQGKKDIVGYVSDWLKEQEKIPGLGPMISFYRPFSRELAYQILRTILGGAHDLTVIQQHQYLDGYESLAISFTLDLMIEQGTLIENGSGIRVNSKA